MGTSHQVSLCVGGILKSLSDKVFPPTPPFFKLFLIDTLQLGGGELQCDCCKLSGYIHGICQAGKFISKRDIIKKENRPKASSLMPGQCLERDFPIFLYPVGGKGRGALPCAHHSPDPPTINSAVKGF